MNLRFGLNIVQRKGSGREKHRHVLLGALKDNYCLWGENLRQEVHNHVWPKGIQETKEQGVLCLVGPLGTRSACLQPHPTSGLQPVLLTMPPVPQKSGLWGWEKVCFSHPSSPAAGENSWAG